MNKWLLILGAGSDIAIEVARFYAKDGYNLYLCARNTDVLQPLCSDLQIRFQIQTQLIRVDFSDSKTYETLYSNLACQPDGVFYCAGINGNQSLLEEGDDFRSIMEVNYLAPVKILNEVARDFEKKQSGFIMAVGSVAGDRGRKKNYFYGSTKAALDAYLSGLRNRLNGSGVHVMTIKPGFVYTKMTEKISLPPLLSATPKAVARDIFLAQKKKKDILYTRWFWFWIMLFIKLIPESFFKKMNL